MSNALYIYDIVDPNSNTGLEFEICEPVNGCNRKLITDIVDFFNEEDPKNEYKAVSYGELSDGENYKKKRKKLKRSVNSLFKRYGVIAPHYSYNSIAIKEMDALDDLHNRCEISDSEYTERMKKILYGKSYVDIEYKKSLILKETDLSCGLSYSSFKNFYFGDMIQCRMLNRWISNERGFYNFLEKYYIGDYKSDFKDIFETFKNRDIMIFVY